MNAYIFIYTNIYIYILPRVDHNVRFQQQFAYLDSLACANICTYIYVHVCIYIYIYIWIDETYITQIRHDVRFQQQLAVLSLACMYVYMHTYIHILVYMY